VRIPDQEGGMRYYKQASHSMRKRCGHAFIIALLVLSGAWPTSAARAAERQDHSKSYGYYVGKSLTEDGSVLLGGTGEEVSSHWLEIVPRKTYPEGATVSVGVTEEASIPGEMMEIPEARETYRYISMFYSDYAGFPAPLTNGGMNEFQVAARDIWAPSRDELVEMTPTPQQGPNYSDLARIALERAKTAREAVEVVGRLIDEHGYSTYGGNSHLFADPQEGWVMLQFAGGKGLWAAERLGPDDVRVLYPGYIEDFPENYRDDPNYMGSDNLISFAVEQGWYDPERGIPFNVHEVYGKQGVPAREPQAKFMSPKQIEEELQDMAPVSVDDMMTMVRDRRIADDEAGYGQVAHLRQDIPSDVALLWVAPTGSVTAPFIPWRIGVQEVPPEFGQHRYLTKGAASSFLNPDFQAQEATQFAGRVFKRLMYYTCEHPEKFLPEVNEALEAFEARLLQEQDEVEEIALTLLDAGKHDLAKEALTLYSNTVAMDGLRLGEALLAGVEARTKVLYGIREPKGEHVNDQGGETVNCLVGQDPDKPPTQ
jgi:dipeptidase